MSQVRTSGCASSSCSWSLLPCSPCAHGNSLLVLCFSYLVFWLSFEVFQCQGNATLPKCLSYLAMNRFMGSQARRFMSVRFLHLRLYRVCSTEVPEKFLQYGQAVGEKRHKQLSPLLSPQHAFSPCNLAFSALAKVKFPVHQGFRVVVQRIACGEQYLSMSNPIPGSSVLAVADAPCTVEPPKLVFEMSRGAMVRPHSVEDWFHFVPTLLEDEGWQIAGIWPAGRQNRRTAILHRSSPWGGHLVRFSMKDIEVHDPPTDTSHLFVRPEVRAWALRTFPKLRDETFEVLDQLAPGEAIVERWASWKFFRMCVLFFGTLGGESLLKHFYHPVMPGKLRQVVRRNYPQRGDSAFAMQSLPEPFEALLVGRPQEPSRNFAVDFVLRVPRNIFAEWVSVHC
eukprot:s2999_g12.t2